MSSIDYHLKELEIAVSGNDPRTVNPTLPDDFASILDVGCGIGQGLGACQLKREVFACGVDIDEAAVRHAKRVAPLHHFVCAQAERLPLSNASFDVVISRVTLPYVHIPTALKEIARVTKDSGEVWFTLHPWQMARSHLFRAIRAGNLKNTLFRIYVIVNGICFHFLGRQFRYPLRRRRCESFQTVRGMTLAMRRAGFEQVGIQLGCFLTATAVKVSKKKQLDTAPKSKPKRELATGGMSVRSE